MATTNEEKSHLATVRMSTEEHARAEAVAAHYGINVSSMVRMLIKRDAASLGVEPASTKTKRTKETNR